MSHSEADVRAMSRCEACNYVLYGEVDRCPECGRTPAEARRVSNPLLTPTRAWLLRASWWAIVRPRRLMRAVLACAAPPWTRMVILAAVWAAGLSLLRPVYLRVGMVLTALDLGPPGARWHEAIQLGHLEGLSNWLTWARGVKWPLWGL